MAPTWAGRGLFKFVVILVAFEKSKLLWRLSVIHFVERLERYFCQSSSKGPEVFYAFPI